MSWMRKAWRSSMRPLKKHAASFTYLTILLVTFSPSIRAQESLQKLCSSDWFAAQRTKWAKDQHPDLRLIEGGLFTQEESSYALAIAFADFEPSGEEGLAQFGDDIRFVVYHGEAGKPNFRQIFSEKLEILSVEFRDDPEKCILKGRPPFWNVSVTDLAGDDKQEIVLETNSTGTCRSCMSLVTVYQIQGDEVTEVVEEPYNEIKFGQGKGLAIHAFEYGKNGMMAGIEKYFFGADHDSLGSRSALPAKMPAAVPETSAQAPSATSVPRGDGKPRSAAPSGIWMAALDRWGPATAGVLLATLCLFAYFQSRSRRKNQ